MEQEIHLLRSICREAEGSIRSIDLALRRLPEPLRQDLLQQRRSYEQIAREAGQQLHGRGERSAVNPLALWRPGLGNPLKQRKQDSLEGLQRSLRSVGQMQAIDPKVASLNRQLLLARQEDMGRMNRLF